LGTNYGKIIDENLSRLFSRLPGDLEDMLGGERRGDQFYLRAFGQDCSIYPDKITLSGKPVEDPRGLLVSLYAINARPDPIQIEPLKSFKDLPVSMPYQGAFRANSEQVLVPHTLLIQERQESIKEAFDGENSRLGLGGDFGFILSPLPKIAVCYIFYLPDDEFQASVTCLFSANALSFMPLDGLADLAEYTSKGILELIYTDRPFNQ
jgi:hypothetical protein